MQNWTSHRLILDLEFILREFAVFDWLIVGCSGLCLGLLVARQLWFRSTAEINQKIAEREHLQTKVSTQPPTVFPEPTAKGLTSDPVQKAPPKKPKLVSTDSDTGVFEAGGEPIHEQREPRRIVYLMDVSQSLDEDQFTYSKKELRKALEKLPAHDFYQVVFFSGSAWFAGQAADEPGDWLSVNQESVSASVSEVSAVETSFGTTWHLPFITAMKLEPAPDEIFFLTDGKAKYSGLLAEQIVQMVQRCSGETRINTIALMVPSAAEPLFYIAQQTGGEFSLVDNNGVIHKGREIDEPWAAEKVNPLLESLP